MSRVFPHSDRKGTEAALDLVEETLASLRKRVEKQQQQQQKESKLKDAATNTSPPPPPSITSYKATKKPRNKSVLIKHKSKYKGKRTRHTYNSSVQEDPGTQVFEKESQKVPQEYCRHCNPRSEGGQSKTNNAYQERRKKRITSPSHSDPVLPGMRDRVIWKHGKRGYRRKLESEDSSQDCLCHDNTCRSLHNDPDPPDVRERVIWKHEKRGHRRKEASEDGSEDCLCYSNTCTSQRPARPLHDDPQPPDVKEKVLWRQGKRGHSRREESDSSCHSNTRKTHRRTRSSSKLKQPTQEDKSTDFGKSKGRQEKREKDASNQVYKEQTKQKDKKAPTHQSLPVDIEHQGYAQSTLTSRLRTDYSRPKKKEKENIINYIPCGSKSHSYHVGVIAQQEIGRLINQPLREHTHTKLQSSSQREGVAATSLTEETVRQAMANIHHHLRGHTVHSDPDL